VKLTLDGVAAAVTVCACIVEARAPQIRSPLCIVLTTRLIDWMRESMSDESTPVIYVMIHP
jgi:hypothetical protein